MKPHHPWTPRTFKQKLQRHGLTRLQAAGLLGVTERTSYNWLSSGPPYVVALVFAMMEQCNLTPADIEAIGNQLTKKRN